MWKEWSLVSQASRGWVILYSHWGYQWPSTSWYSISSTTDFNCSIVERSLWRTETIRLRKKKRIETTAAMDDEYQHEAPPSPIHLDHFQYQGAPTFDPNLTTDDISRLHFPGPFFYSMKTRHGIPTFGGLDIVSIRYWRRRRSYMPSIHPQNILHLHLLFLLSWRHQSRLKFFPHQHWSNFIPRCPSLHLLWFR